MAGEETELYSADIVPSEKGVIEASYRFDPISLAVYKNAVKFRAILYSETKVSTIEIIDFSIKAVCESKKYTKEQRKIFSSLLIHEKGETCVMVQQNNGNKITVPVIPKQVLFIGNSLLLGMCNTYGMCSTSPKKDYAYYVQQSILKYNKDCLFYKLHGSNFEHAESVLAFEKWFSEEENIYTQMPARESFTEDLDLILIQLTDNVNTDDKIVAFNKNVDLFMERLKEMCPKARIIWITGWYNKLNTFDKVVEICEQWGLEYIDISDLHVSENESHSGQISWHPEERNDSEGCLDYASRRPRNAKNCRTNYKSIGN